MIDFLRIVIAVFLAMPAVAIFGVAVLSLLLGEFDAFFWLAVIAAILGIQAWAANPLKASAPAPPSP